MDRRTVIGAGIGAAGLLALGGIAPARMAAAPGLALPTSQAAPADMAPPEQQVLIFPTGLEATVLDFYEQVYSRPLVADQFSEPLVRLNKNFELLPAAASSWSGSEDGKTWTFILEPDRVWSDGNPVTANDWVATFRYAADPTHAWDFTWYFQNVLKGWNDAIAGKIPLDQLGVRQGADPYTLIFETEVPAPFLPAMLLYSAPLSAAGLEKTGPLYNVDPATAITSGPFKLTAWDKDQQIVYEKNPGYKGKLVVPVNKVVLKIADPKTWFTLYDNNEVDYMEKPAPAELKLMQADPEKAKQIYSGVGDFRCYYLFFDVSTAPFDDIKVRQAFSHVVDRDAIQEAILGPSGRPAYSWLAPGFPAANGEALADIQKYDPALGKQLLAEAGFPNGEGFPKQTLWLRNENPINQNVANAIASMIKEQLGVDVEVSNKDTDTFMDSLTAKPTQLPFGYVSYGMDFLDPFNMLSVWLSGGRHSWANPEFDAKVKEGASFLGAPEDRTKIFQDAERILVTDVPGVFVYHETPVQLIKPYVKGEFLAPDENGISSMHWPGYSPGQTVPGELYISTEVSEYRQAP